MFACGIHFEIFHDIRCTSIHAEYKAIATRSTSHGVVSSTTVDGVITRKTNDAVGTRSYFIAINIDIVIVDYVVAGCAGYNTICIGNANKVVAMKCAQLNILKDYHLSIWQIDMYIRTYLTQQWENLGLELGVTKCSQVNLFIHCIDFEIFYHIRCTRLHSEYKVIATGATSHTVVSSPTIDGVVTGKAYDAVCARGYFIAIYIYVVIVDNIVTSCTGHNAICIRNANEIIATECAQLNILKNYDLGIWQIDMYICTDLAQQWQNLGMELGITKGR